MDTSNFGFCLKVSSLGSIPIANFRTNHISDEKKEKVDDQTKSLRKHSIQLLLHGEKRSKKSLNDDEKKIS